MYEHISISSVSVYNRPGDWWKVPWRQCDFCFVYSTLGMAQMVKNTPAMWETWIRSLGWEDPLEKGKATHSSILAWRIPWTEDPGGLQDLDQRV